MYSFVYIKVTDLKGCKHIEIFYTVAFKEGEALK